MCLERPRCHCLADCGGAWRARVCTSKTRQECYLTHGSTAQLCGHVTATSLLTLGTTMDRGCWTPRFVLGWKSKSCALRCYAPLSCTYVTCRFIYLWVCVCAFWRVLTIATRCCTYVVGTYTNRARPAEKTVCTHCVKAKTAFRSPERKAMLKLCF